MTINTAPAKNWSQHNSGQDDPKFNTCSPNLLAIKTEMTALWGVGNLGCYGERAVRAGIAPSAHSHGAAIDLRYLEQIGRTRFENEVVPWLIANSAELHVGAIHDYIGCRVWHAGRTTNAADAYTGWWKTQTPNPATGMGEAWAGWVHIETTEPGWTDATPVAKRLTSFPPTTPKPETPPDPEMEDDMKPVFVGATDGRQGLWMPGNPVQEFENPDQRDTILAYLGIDPNAGLTISPGQFDRLQ